VTSTRPGDEDEPRERRPSADEEDAATVVRHVGSTVELTMGSTVASVAAQMRRRAAAAEAERDAVLASDADRDTAVRVLADAFSVGRLSATELEERTGKVLAARTHGELDDLLAGLGGYPVARQAPRWRKVAFGIVAFFTSPFVLMGSAFLLFGQDVGDHVAGLVFLALFLPGWFGLWRWAWPKR
jgi:hypothetical protein